MTADSHEVLRFRHTPPRFEGSTLVMAFSGWMDGGEVSTGTVERLVELLRASPLADIDGEPFYIYNFPGTMELTSLFRPHIAIEEGLIKRLDMPANTFYTHAAAELFLFVGKEPNLNWRLFADTIFRFCREVGVRRILFVGSFGGAVPHTRQPRLYVTVSDEKLLPEMERYGVRRSGYEGPGSFTTYMMMAAPRAGIEMTSLVAEIPGYLQGANPVSIEAVTRRLAQILQLPLDLDSLRTASTDWELQVSSAVEQDDDLAEQIRKLEKQYDDDLLEETDE